MTSHRALALWLPLAVLLALLNAPPALAAPEDDVRTLNANLDRAYAAAQAGDLAAARSAFAAYESGWPAIEDGVKARSRSSYRSIEDGMKDAKVAFSTQPVDQRRVASALLELQRRGNQFAAGGAPAPAASSAAAENTPTISSDHERMV